MNLRIQNQTEMMKAIRLIITNKKVLYEIF